MHMNHSFKFYFRKNFLIMMIQTTKLLDLLLKLVIYQKNIKKKATTKISFFKQDFRKYFIKGQ